MKRSFTFSLAFAVVAVGAAAWYWRATHTGTTGGSSVVASPINPNDFLAVAAATPIEDRKSEEVNGIRNIFKLSDRITEGAEPEGEAAFATLQKRGIKTIVSVDSKAPDVATAARYGMRYVHIPFGYHGIGADDQLRLTKTFRETEGPFFVHCFNGTHRGAAAAAIGRMVVDNASHERVLSEMYHWCGTSKTYSGLYDSVGAFQLPSEETTKKLAYAMPSVAPIADFNEIMVRVSRADEFVKRLDKRGFAADPKHPDLDAENEAAKLAQAFAGAQKLEDFAGRPEDYRNWMQKAERLSRSLQSALHDFKSGESAAASRASDIYKQIGATCVDCHQAYRNHSPITPH